MEWVPLPAVVAGEYDKCASIQTGRSQRLEDAADSGIHTLHHLCVCAKAASVGHWSVIVVDGLIVRPVPRPMRRVVLKAEKEGPVSLPRDEANGTLREEVCEISLVLGGF